MNQAQQFCTFLLEGNLFGIPVAGVQEVIQFHQMTPVPLAPSVVAGMINLRGQIVLVVDLRRRLEFGERSAATIPMNVVVRTAAGAVSLLVDEIGDVVEVSESMFEPPPETVRGPVRGMIFGVYKIEGKLLHVLDAETACQVSGALEAHPPGDAPCSREART